jgi:hypothetical protein
MNGWRFKVGDKVKCLVDYPNNSEAIGDAIYPVVEEDKDGWFWIETLDGTRFRVNNDKGYFELISTTAEDKKLNSVINILKCKCEWNTVYAQGCQCGGK